MTTSRLSSGGAVSRSNIDAGEVPSLSLGSADARTRWPSRSAEKGPEYLGQRLSEPGCLAEGIGNSGFSYESPSKRTARRSPIGSGLWSGKIKKGTLYP
jgi:hypothetical protein